VVGSAQRRTSRALLQQGSVLLGGGHLRLADYVAVPAAERENLRRDLQAVSDDLGRFIARDAPLPLWANALAGELGEVCRMEGAQGVILLTPAERGSYTAAFS
jgi:hypothetical protein